MELLQEIFGGVLHVLIDFCRWFFLTFLQGVFNVLLPTENARLIRLQWLGAALLLLGLEATVGSPFVGILFGFAWGGGMFGGGVFAILVVGAIGGRIEDAVREERRSK